MKVNKMKFFSPSQEDIYESAKSFIILRLERILELSNTAASQEAFFFILGIMQDHKTKSVDALIDIFYQEPHQIIKNFLRDLNGWMKAENNNSKFIKAITEPRLRASDKQGLEYTEELQREFARNIAEDIRQWGMERAHEHFYSAKYSLLCAKYSNILNSDLVETPGLSS